MNDDAPASNPPPVPSDAQPRAAPERAARSQATDPPSEPPSVALGQPVLRAVLPLATLGLVALFVGRALAPALVGVGVGMGSLVYLVGVIGAVASQVFAFAAMMVGILSILAAARSRLPLGLRIASLTLGGFAILPTVWALHQVVPDASAAVAAGSASLLAALAAPTALRAPFARAAGLVIALVAIGGLVRLGAVGLALQAATPATARFATFARSVATVAFLLDAAAIVIALVWIASRTKKLTSPVTLVVLALALFLTRQALAGQGDDAQAVDLFMWRIAARLLSRPDAALPLAVRVFVAFLAPLVAAAALAARDALGSLRAGIALALLARGAIEMPPCSLMVIVGALAVALTAREGLWSAIASRPRVPDDARS